MLGYLILLGLLLLHCAVLASVVAPSELSCGARRMLPALAYALIFAAMFLKVGFGSFQTACHSFRFCCVRVH